MKRSTNDILDVMNERKVRIYFTGIALFDAKVENLTYHEGKDNRADPETIRSGCE